MNGTPKYPAGYGVRKRRSQKVAFAVFRILSLFITVILFAILGFIIVKEPERSAGTSSRRRPKTA